jgi:hypothetical protein
MPLGRAHVFAALLLYLAPSQQPVVKVQRVAFRAPQGYMQGDATQAMW